MIENKAKQIAIVQTTKLELFLSHSFVILI